MKKVVLDASAVLVVLNNEAGADVVADYLSEGVISAVNSAEVIGKLAEAGMPGAVAVNALNILSLQVVLFDRELAARTGALRPLTKHLGLSLGDRACLATAERLELPVVTADLQWKEIKLPITIKQIR